MKNQDDGRRDYGPRVNFNIRVPTIRVVRDKEQLGIMPTDKACRLAMDEGLDLVEIAPTAKPPVCHIMDFAKYKYEQKLKEKNAKKNQKQQELKEIKLTPVIEQHDVDTKVGFIRRFLSEGKRVQLTLEYRRRENAHKEEGFKVINNILDMLVNDCEVGRKPSLEGKRLVCVLQPKGAGK